MSELERLRKLVDEARPLAQRLCAMGITRPSDDRLLAAWDRADKRYWRRWHAWRELRERYRR